jgi:hypothetical protein
LSLPLPAQGRDRFATKKPAQPEEIMREFEQAVAEDVTTNITPELEADFEALTSGEYSNFALVSCFVDGTPTVAIAIVEKDKKTKQFDVTPLFVSITPNMVLTDHDGNELEHNEPEDSDEPEDQDN